MSIVINDTTPRVHYTSGAGQTTFDVPFEFLAISDVYVYVGEVLQTYSATPQFNTEYNLIGAGTNDVKRVIFGGGGRLAGELVVIYRDMPIKSPADFPTEGVFPVTELNTAMDSLTAMIQQTEVNVLLRSLTLDWADEPRALNPIPNHVVRANKILGFDIHGQPIAVVAGSGSGLEADAATLNGQPGSYYLDRTYHTGQDEIADIIGLQDNLNLKAPINSPVLTGEPHSVTPPAEDNSTRIATTAFVQMEVQDRLVDAPADAATYGRRNGAWTEVPREAPVDLNIYGRSGKQWVPVTGGSGGGGGGSGGASLKIDVLPPEAALHGDMWWDSDAGGLYIYYNDGNTSQWVQAAAPSLFDTQTFAKKTDITGMLTETVGDWTPAFNFGGVATGITYGARTGRWRRAGSLVTIWFDFTLTSKGAATGVAVVSGIPVLPRSGMIYGGSVAIMDGLLAGSHDARAFLMSASYISLFVPNNTPATATGNGPMSHLHVTNTTRLAGSLSYEAA